MSMSKYFHEQGDHHGGVLSWPGFNDLPVRGDVGLLKDEELDEFFEVARDFRCKEFDLNEPDQVIEYTKVMDRIVNGWYSRLFVDNYRDEKDGHRKVYLEWVQSYGQINPKAKTRLAPADGSSIQRVG